MAPVAAKDERVPVVKTTGAATSNIAVGTALLIPTFPATARDPPEAPGIRMMFPPSPFKPPPEEVPPDPAVRVIFDPGPVSPDTVLPDDPAVIVTDPPAPPPPREVAFPPFPLIKLIPAPVPARAVPLPPLPPDKLIPEPAPPLVPPVPVEPATLSTYVFPVLPVIARSETDGLVLLIPTFPDERIRIASVPPLFPTKNLMKSVVPAPEVDCSESDEPAPVPPITKGSVIEVVKVGAVPKTAAPEPVSSVRAVKRLDEVNEPSEAALPTEVTIPVRLALVVTFPAVRPEAVPVRLVATPELGVPSAPPLVTNDPAVPMFTPRAVKTPVPAPVSPVLIGRPVPLVRVTADGVPKFGVVKTGEVVYATTPVPDSSDNIVAKFAEVSALK